MTVSVSREWIFRAGEPPLITAGNAIAERYLADETSSVKFLLEHARLPATAAAAVQREARTLVETIRRKKTQGLDAFLAEYDLSSSEGIVLMCLAEALLRIPDDETADKLIAEKLGEADWEAHLGASESLFVNASTWALLLTGRLLRAEELPVQPVARVLSRLMDRLGDAVVRAALRQAMRILGRQLVIGRTIDEALRRADEAPQYCYSFDMLGEAALTAKDAERYFEAYLGAIAALKARSSSRDITTAPSVSVKLSALHPRYEYAQRERCVRELADRLEQLTVAAIDAGCALTVDAEESDRLELSLAVFERVFKRRSPASSSGGFGIAVQAYQKRAWPVLLWLEELARGRRSVIPVRLVKGAYWDTEIKRAQQQGLSGYPVFTRKSSTDVSYLACAKLLLHESPHLYPQFATHNAHTVAWLMHVGARDRFELQRLHGMGEELYDELLNAAHFDRPVRVYAPVGSHEDLLPYLVRRLLENGANTSFVNRLTRADTPIDDIVADPVAITESRLDSLPHPRIPLPIALFGRERANARGVNLSDGLELGRLAAALARTEPGRWKAAPMVDGRRREGAGVVEQRDPADRRRIAGRVAVAGPEEAREALAAAASAWREWNDTPVQARASMLERAADRFEADAPELIARCIAEAGKTLADAVAEVREAVDFLRYYAAEARRLFAAPAILPGPTGEHNELRLNGRGVFVCISPWNFPLAIFTGQVAAALVAGNTVLAKPAEQSTLVAARAVELLAAAGLPREVLQLGPGDGPTIADALLPDGRIAGVAFTGSVETARAIDKTLAGRDGPLATLIAETGGVNAMIVDSSALPEQVVRDA